MRTFYTELRFDGGPKLLATGHLRLETPGTGEARAPIKSHVRKSYSDAMQVIITNHVRACVDTMDYFRVTWYRVAAVFIALNSVYLGRVLCDPSVPIGLQHTNYMRGEFLPRDALRNMRGVCRGKMSLCLSVCLPVCLSVCYTPVLCRNG